jgi:MATE family multidrug resistance protein
VEVVTFNDCLVPLFTAKTLDMKMWCEFLGLGIPGTLMQCAEWWAFEIIVVFAGLMGPHQQAAQVAVINIIGLLYMIPLGIQFAAAGLVGEQFGANNPEMVKKFAIMCTAFGLAVYTVVMILCIVFEDYVASFFTKDPEDIYYVKTVLQILPFYLIADVIHGV